MKEYFFIFRKTNSESKFQDRYTRRTPISIRKIIKTNSAVNEIANTYSAG